MLERKWVVKEREERRRNIIIKGAEVKEGKRKEAVEEVIEALGVKAEIEGVWKLGRGEREEREMIEELEGEERESGGGLDVGRKTYKVEIGGNSKKGRKKGKTSLGGIWEDKDRRAVVEMG